MTRSDAVVLIVKQGKLGQIRKSDNPARESNYLLFQMILEKDYRLAHAWNGREVVDMFPKTNPDLILMDINMPFMDGYEATRHIRQRSTTVPIIAVTAYAFSSDKARIMENGFNSYVSKPINTDRLLGEIKRCIG